MSRLVVGPFNRVEGDLEVKLEISDGAVGEARVVSTLYRGYERILLGKAPFDALVYAPRICGICSISQSVAAAHALAGVQGIHPPENGRIAINIIHAAENVADHLTHFYLFFMPDFARAAYAGRPWHLDAAARFEAIRGAASADMLPARAQFLHIMGLLAGKWPHSLSIQPGGVARAIGGNDIARLQGILAGFRRFLERTLFGDALERIAGLTSVDALAAWAAEKPPQSGDMRRFLLIAGDLALERLGRAGDRFMSYGAYGSGAQALFPAGVWSGGKVTPFDPGAITEDVSHAWYSAVDGAVSPFAGTTHPDADRPDGYSWCKAPRLAGAVVEVGALARQLIAGQELIAELVARGGGNVFSRVVARLVEIARVTLAMQRWSDALIPGEAFSSHAAMPDEGRGIGLTEAARGALGHWIEVRRGRIANYQIVAPTTWNFSPRDAHGTPGALERALVGAPVLPGESEPVAVQHIVRSFDPCLVCTVH